MFIYCFEYKEYMDHEEHCRYAMDRFGDGYPEIHCWLDEFFSLEGWKHRKYRHHSEGVEMAREVFGDIGALVAEQHIRLDNPATANELKLIGIENPDVNDDGWLPKKVDYNIMEYD
jgi:hypothetical protein